MSEGAFFQDLAILTTVAAVAAVVFSRLKWPKVLGYILAGIVMSEYTWGGSFLQDPQSISTIAQLGVVFLMFAMGLSFSAKEMRKIQAVALPCAVVDTIGMIWLGYTAGTRLFGWSAVESVFLGVAICDSATTLLAKVIGEMGWSQRPFAKCALGTSVCEDIVCVGAIAVATGFAQGGGMSVGAFMGSLGGLFVFFLAVFVFGLILVPRLLTSVARQHDSETLVLSVLGCCLFVSYVAYSLDFSLALGAFLVGILVSTSPLRLKIADLVDPLKALFAAMFFVSIGLLVNPAAILSCLPQILVVSLIVIVGKILNNTVVSLAAGVDVKTAVQIGFSLAQIGEFAFMVAILYAGLVNTNESKMFQIAVGVSLLTTVLNPVLVRLSDRVGDAAEHHVPAHLNEALVTYRAWLDKIGASSGSPAFLLLKNAAIRLGIYAVLIVAVTTLCSIACRFDFARFSVFFERHDRVFFFLLANLFAIAMLPLIVSAARAFGDELAVLVCGEADTRWRSSVQPLVRFAAVTLVVALFFVGMTMLDVSISPFTGWVEKGAGIALVGAAFTGWRFFVKAGRRATQRFTEALTAEERREGLVKTMTLTLPEGTVQRLKLDASSPAIGSTIGSLNIRAKTGASVVSVYRDGTLTRNVGPEWELNVGDTLVVLGESTQIAALKDLLGIVS